jgi:hypothetical protein
MEHDAEIIHNLSYNKQFLQEYGERCVALGIASVPAPETPFDTKILRSSMIPRSFRKELYYIVCNLNPLFNSLIDRIASDIDYLADIHRGTSDHSS